MVATENCAADKQIASITRDSTAGLTAPVRLSGRRRLNQQVACAAGMQPRCGRTQSLASYHEPFAVDGVDTSDVAARKQVDKTRH